MSTPSVQEKLRDVKPSSAQDDPSGRDYIYILVEADCCFNLMARTEESSQKAD